MYTVSCAAKQLQSVAKRVETLSEKTRILLISRFQHRMLPPSLLVLSECRDYIQSVMATTLKAGGGRGGGGGENQTSLLSLEYWEVFCFSKKTLFNESVPTILQLSCMVVLIF